VSRLRVAFDAGLPLARWSPLFQVLRLEQPGVKIEWQPMGFPTPGRSVLDGVDIGLFVQPPPEPGLDGLDVETSQMVVTMAVGHRLAAQKEIRVADILDEAFPGGPNLHAAWTAFWTLDEQRGGPPTFTDDPVENAEDGLEVVAAGRAIATIPASLAGGLAHPGVVALPVVDGPPVVTRLVWRSGDENPIVQCLVSIAEAMAGDLGEAMQAQEPLAQAQPRRRTARRGQRRRPHPDAMRRRRNG
jgi:DNA-binding transcriptional LysR family regulator